ncbi:cation-transporting P-type ATPase [Chryseobacterium sp. WG14]|uniref:cation-transporting P-type ATPase n=1 Tax=Chryseobacterium sp. WG14 TaxID=2926909 RepID=UPI00211DA550|nr:cation-transporting P-type ATPase [Chryseobacterium sp. WG14]MCQ9640834.1 cation-transporting P-type ATPase [Chryseobacterium sp. WG14]
MLKKYSNKNLNSATLVKLKEAASENEKMIYAMLETSEEGLSENTVKDRLKIYGKNEIATQKAPSWLKQFAHYYGVFPLSDCHSYRILYPHSVCKTTVHQKIWTVAIIGLQQQKINDVTIALQALN